MTQNLTVVYNLANHMSPSPIIITFIHGTFDRGARWTQEDSIISQVLATEIGQQQPLLLCRPDWSGRNRQTDREIAANRLIGHIHQQSIHFPSSKHFLIGHSHGGNIILWALERAPKTISKSITAVVTVSTPFLEFRPRDEFSEVHGLALLSRLCFAAILLFTWMALIASPSGWYGRWLGWLAQIIQPLPAIITILFLSTLAIWALSSALFNSLERRLLAIFDTWQTQALRLYPTRVVLNIPFLCVYTRWDEISVAFSVGNVVANVIRATGAIPEIARLIYSNWLRKVLEPFFGGLAILAIFFLMFIVIGNAAGRNVSGHILFAYVAPVALFGLAISVGVPILAGIGLAVMGKDRALDLMVFDYKSSVRPSRVERPELLVVSPHRLPFYFAGQNFHTNLMYDPFVANLISRYIVKLVS